MNFNRQPTDPHDPEAYWEFLDRRREAIRDRTTIHHFPTPSPQLPDPMMLKRYLENLVCQCSEEAFGQDAVEWAILDGHISLTYNLVQDLAAIMGPLAGFDGPGKPPTLYDRCVEEYQAVVRNNERVLLDSYLPLLEELNRSTPLAA